MAPIIKIRRAQPPYSIIPILSNNQNAIKHNVYIASTQTQTDVDSNHNIIKSQIEYSSSPHTQNQIRQLSLDNSTPTRSSQPATSATTRRTANPTTTDLDPNTSQRQAQSIRTTRSDNPTAVANLDIGSSSSTKTSTANSNDQQETPDSSSSFTRTTTIHPSATSSSANTTTRTTQNVRVNSDSSSTESEGSILAQAVATSNISWWQLLAIIICGILALSVGSWLFFRSRQRKRYKRKEKKKQDLEDKLKEKESIKRELELMKTFKHNKRLKGKNEKYFTDSDSDDYSEDYSDDETIPKRSGKYRKRKKDRKSKRRRRYDSEEEEDDESIYERELSREKEKMTPKSAFSFRPSSNKSKSALNRKKSFRDSVFSTYNSMKKSAIKLKYVEAKVKLEKQLEQEEILEKERKEKILKANEEIKIFNNANRELEERQNTLKVFNDINQNQQIGREWEEPKETIQNQWSNNNDGIDSNQQIENQNWVNINDKPRGKLLIPPMPRQQSTKTHSAEIPTAALLPYHSNRSRDNSFDGEISNLLGNPKSSSSSSSASESLNDGVKAKKPDNEPKEMSKQDKRKVVMPIQPSISITKPEASHQRGKSKAYVDVDSDSSDEEEDYYPSQLQVKKKSSQSNFIESTMGLSKSFNNDQKVESKKGYTNPFSTNSDWLSKSGPVQTSPTEMDFNFNSRMNENHSSSIPNITHPNDNPVMSRLNLFGSSTNTAGSVSLRGKGSLGYGLQSGSRENTIGGGNKWANRLRERK
ncbi:uncharacterized protein I206_105811 [Kwoniella pini CBS 10737]|uniref:Uncharacterized protein n=1 Tax=Kwoniella pini CBS 10737 TaxID=1296096 RepID=A0A1B9I0B2_9TREE|nr:uncharacterized protein I206_04631 [Kwoniella pini CBS 10737]OCF48944.1 hypothetical protein I206_04631 [Kwoniella pini CBS 10737]